MYGCEAESIVKSKYLHFGSPHRVARDTERDISRKRKRTTSKLKAARITERQAVENSLDIMTWIIEESVKPDGIVRSLQRAPIMTDRSYKVSLP
jgi:hypothetical protein